MLKKFKNGLENNSARWQKMRFRYMKFHQALQYDDITMEYVKNWSEIGLCQIAPRQIMGVEAMFLSDHFRFFKHCYKYLL